MKIKKLAKEKSQSGTSNDFQYNPVQSNELMSTVDTFFKKRYKGIQNSQCSWHWKRYPSGISPKNNTKTKIKLIMNNSVLRKVD